MNGHVNISSIPPHCVVVERLEKPSVYSDDVEKLIHLFPQSGQSFELAAEQTSHCSRLTQATFSKYPSADDVLRRLFRRFHACCQTLSYTFADQFHPVTTRWPYHLYPTTIHCRHTLYFDSCPVKLWLSIHPVLMFCHRSHVSHFGNSYITRANIVVLL
jgi:hypothetical protein